MDLFKIFGTVSLNGQDEVNKNLSSMTTEGEKTQSKMKTAFEGMGKVAVASAKAMATALATSTVALIKFSKDSIGEYAEYEQLVGGVETLFKTSADKIMQYSKVAYQTAGLSANDYMNTVTSFSASLLQGLKGNTDKAAEMSNLAIVDMSDNANKMGTTMDSIQTAYQGFAKQNYTMLDNLKLGYGGTASEMARLINDSGVLGKQTEITSDTINTVSFDKIIEAIHKLQTKMGITGTTAKEASTTIQGSTDSMKASWTNLMTGMSDPNQDLAKLLSNVVDSATTVVSNVTPRIVEILPRISDGLNILSEEVIKIFPSLIGGLLPALLQSASDLVNSFVKILPDLLETLIQAVSSALPLVIPTLLDGALKLVVALVVNLPAIIEPLLESLPAILLNVVDTLIDNLPLLIDGCINLVVGLLEHLPEIILGLIEAVPHIIKAIVLALFNAIPQLWNGLKTINDSLTKFLIDFWNGCIQSNNDFTVKLLTKVKNAVYNFGKWVGEKLKTIKSNLVSLPSKAGEFVAKLIKFIKAKFNLPHFTFSGSVNPLEWATKGIPKIGVEWYAKAMDNGIIMNEPTAFGYNPQTNSILAGGETGSETVVGTNNLMGMIENAVSSMINNLNIDLYLDGDMLVGGTASRMDTALGKMSVIRRRGVIV